jgi:hypothetical protein
MRQEHKTLSSDVQPGQVISDTSAQGEKLGGEAGKVLEVVAMVISKTGTFDLCTACREICLPHLPSSGQSKSVIFYHAILFLIFI